MLTQVRGERHGFHSSLRSTSRLCRLRHLSLSTGLRPSPGASPGQIQGSGGHDCHSGCHRTNFFTQAFSSELLGMQKETFDVDDVHPMPIDESLV